MRTYRLSSVTRERLAEIRQYTQERWGEDQAYVYTEGLFATFDGIVENRIRSRLIPEEYGVDGWVTRYRSHFIYWRELSDGNIGIATILHVSMDLPNRLKKDFSP